MFARNIRIALILIILSTSDAQAQDAALDWEALNQGEVIIEEVTTESGIPGVRALFLVKAARETIWYTLLDYDNFPKFFEGIIRMKVLKQGQNGAHIEYWVDAVVMDLHYILYRNYAEPGYRLTWRRVAGDLKVIEGSWKILDTDDREKKLLIYESYVDIGFSLITWAIRQGAKRKAKKMGQRLRDWLENEQIYQ